MVTSYFLYLLVTCPKCHQKNVNVLPGSSVTGTVSGTSIGNATESELDCEEKTLKLGQKNMMKLDDIGSKMNQYIKMYWICKYLCTNCFKPQSPTNWWHLHSCHKKIAVKVASNVGDTVQTVHVIVKKRIYCELQVWFQRDIEEKWQAKCRVESSDANPARQFGFPNRCWLSLVDAVNSWWGRSQQNMGWNGSFMFCQGILRNAGWWYCWWCLVG